ncbi:MAG: serine/threonine protein kinase [Planctomycetes bacterium]|nr:serine/threonine protein kinase [Planctomycetota bacterium]
MTEKASCPSCGASWEPGPGAEPSDGCPGCGVALAGGPAEAGSPDAARGLDGRGLDGRNTADRAGDGTVGEHPTAGPGTSDTPANWQEGVLVADRFRILKFVGQGGMGTVYLALDETLGRQIALKCVPQEILFDGDARDDLRQEANRLLDLAHENIVRIHTYYDGSSGGGGRPLKTDGWPFFAMEYLQGPTLKQLLHLRKQDARVFSVAEGLLVARQVARGLSYAHSKGIIHRDLKPGNLMLAETPDGDLGDGDVVKITDFGISRVIADSTVRQTGRRSGTLPYMSPEQYRGEPCTARSDTYSLACTIYELVSGKPPFSSGDIGYQILHKDPKPIPGVPRPFSDALLRGLSKDPRERFASVEDFVRGLEGKPVAARPRSPSALVALASMAAGIVLVVGLAALLAPRPGRDEPAQRQGAEPAPAAVVRAKPAAPSAAQQAETDEFTKRLREELGRQVPFPIGRDFPYATAVTPDTISLRVAVPEPRASSFQRGLLESLVLLYHGESARDRKEKLKGAWIEGYKVFDLDGLAEGLYSLRAYVESPGATSLELLEAPHKFRVDLTPPSFQVLPVSPAIFIDPAAPYRSTFDEVVDLKLVSTHDPGDITEAYATIVFGEGTRPWARLERLPFWRVELPPGSMTTYRVYAKDAAGNRSAAIEVSLRRLRLAVESFGLAGPEGVQGNLATVKGILRVEGDQSPSLKYFINDRPAEPVPRGPRGDEAWGDPAHGSREPGGIPFNATLVLPQSANNAIEVRYGWQENPPQPFPVPAKISDVKVRAPRVTLEELPGRTAQARLRLAGKVEPWFDGLGLGVEQKGQASRQLALQASRSGSQAAFGEDLDLADGENALILNAYYRDSPLGGVSPVLTVYLDKISPGLDGPAAVDALGDSIHVVLRATEELRTLRVQQVWASGEASAWREVELDRMSMAYVFSTPIPAKPFTFKIDMTDLAGNVGHAEQLCAVTRADVAGLARAALSDRSGTAPAAIGALEKGEAGDVTVAGRVPGLTLIASRFLKDLGMDFVPVGQERLEVSRTEVPERAWFQFLKDKGHGDLGSGRLDAPMTLEDFSPELLRDFVRWFEEKSGDGYRYEVPTREQWLHAFAGTSDGERARQVVSDWFRGSLKGESRFHPRPEVRYGQGRTSSLGARPENRSPAGLLDMEANVQELVLYEGGFNVIGGTDRDAEDALLGRCLEARPYDADTRILEGRLTGFRLARRPLGAK